MSKEALDVVGIGNAIVDVLSRTDDSFLKNNGLKKGAMTLVDDAHAGALYAKMGTCIEMSGGSAANTIAALASLGGKAGYIGKVASDQMGEVFRHDIRSTGVVYDTLPLLKEGVKTSRCLVMVAPDSQRTMCTYLGASVFLMPMDIDEKMIKNAQVTYLEGYLFDLAHAKRAFRMAAEIAHAAGKKIALTLSDPFCVERHRDDFIDLVKNHVDILFANEAEIKALYKTDHFPDALPQCRLAVITRSEKGSVIVDKKETIKVAAESVKQVIDTTGAGDLYAAGFLYGYTRGKSLAECGRIASIAAGEIISQIGARPLKNLAQVLLDKKIS